ncbi:MAG: hypothetical protein EBX41_09060, partial [Chitinophagia bacterium]|nr:hypothetical protein [Chitinophagia bacterium]
MVTHMGKKWLFILFASTFVFAASNTTIAKGSKKTPTTRTPSSDPSKPLSFQRELEMANSLYGQGSYFNAIDHYQTLKSADERNPFLTYNLAECYRATRDYVPAAHYYVEAYYLNKTDYPRSAFFAGQMFKQQGEYEQAMTWFNRFLDDNKKTSSAANQEDPYNRLMTQKEVKEFKKRCKMEIDGCKMAIESIKEPQPVTIFNCGPNVNTPNTELSPFPYGDSSLLFSTITASRAFGSESDRGIAINVLDPQKYKEHFMVTHKQPGYVDSFQWPLPFNDGGFNDPNFHTGNGCYSPNGDVFYYTKCGEADSFILKCAIYYSRWGQHNWTVPELVGGNVNDGESSNTMPYLAKVGKKMILFFASDRKLQSRGGYDLWYSVVDPRNNTFRRPQNCGKQINTSSDELTPYYDNRVNKLYFASNGRKSFGGFDIFSADGGPSRYKNVQNMGYPINTSADEFYYIKDPVGKPDAYIVSNRIGTTALKNPTCCNDIWRIQSEPRLVVIGKVVDKKTQQPITQTVVKMADQKGNVNTFNSEDGNFLFNMQRNHSYIITSDKAGYTSSRASISTMTVKRSDPDDTITVTVYLDTIKKSFEVSNIYYSYDSANLRPESIASLDTILAFMKDNPSIYVEIYSYTDGKGKPEYNLALSQRRAQAVLDYLEKNGINVKQLVGGYIFAGKSHRRVRSCTNLRCIRSNGFGDLNFISRKCVHQDDVIADTIG